MRLLILIVSLWSLAHAKPEMYKEKEDFQFSRSSSDDGSKSGYYGAQRGNMGGNYEKAHNMDSLAQHQMSTLVRQVDGELGQGANTRTGSVFTAGNSRGIYGSGQYDLSNLKGRNFEEGGSFGDSHSLTSQSAGYSGSTYSAANNARYSASQLRALGHNSEYQTSGLTSQYGQFDNQQAETQHTGASNYEYGGQGASNYKHYHYGGSQASREYDQRNNNLQSFDNYYGDTRGRLITIPVRLYGRPGTRVAIPVAAQNYDASQGSLVHEQSAVNSDAEVVSNNGQRIAVIKPVAIPKHYESSYSYKKEWEKHDSIPVTAIPTINPFPKNSELYEDSQLSQATGQNYQSEVDARNTQSSRFNSAYSNQIKSGVSANVQSAATNRLQYQSQLENSGVTGTSNAYTLGKHSSGTAANLNSFVDSTNSRPKSYQSSYSYHKSWERRGDPYIIKPVGDETAQASQRLLDASTTGSNVYSSTYGNHRSQMSHSLDDCDQNGHLRMRRSYNLEPHQQMYQNNYQEEFTNNLLRDLEYLRLQAQNKQDSELYSQLSPHQWSYTENLGHQTMKNLDDLQRLNQYFQNSPEDLSQQSQSELSNTEDFRQQIQNQWDDLYSYNQHLQNIHKDLSQSYLGNLEGQQTQNKWDNLESLNQHLQSSSEDLSQQTQSNLDNSEDLGQQTQNNWDNLESLNKHPQSVSEDISQQSQSQLSNSEDLGQQTQNNWDDLQSFNQHLQSGPKDLSQQSQSHSDHLEDLGQQTQNQWDKLESFNHHSERGSEDLSQQSQSQLSNSEDLGQQTQSNWDDLQSFNQNLQSAQEDLSQQSQSHSDHLENLGQQTQSQWDNLESFNQHSQRGSEDLSQQSQSQSQLSNSEDLGQQTQSNWDDLQSFNQHLQSAQEDLSQQSQSHSDHLENLGQQTQNQWDNLESLNQHSQRGSEDLSQQSQSQLSNSEDLGQQTQSNWDDLQNFNQHLQCTQEDLSQQSQSHSDHLENLGQQTQNQWDNLESFNQHSQRGSEDLSQQSQSQLTNLEDLGQQTQSKWDSLESLNQHPQSNSEDFKTGQQSHNTWNTIQDQQQRQVEQQTQVGNFEQFENQNKDTENSYITNFVGSQNHMLNKDNNKESQKNIENYNDKPYTLPHPQVNFDKQNNLKDVEDKKKPDDHNQQNLNPWDNLFEELDSTKPTDKEEIPAITNNKDNYWDIIDKIISEIDKDDKEDQNTTSWKKEENFKIDNNNHNTTYSYHQYHFNQSKETVTEKEEKNTQTASDNTSITTNKNLNTSEKEKKSEVHEDTVTNYRINPEDYARGDIGPDDIPTELTENDKQSIDISHDKLYKTQKEVEILSLTNDKTDLNKNKLNNEPVILNVIGLKEQFKLTTTSTRKPIVDFNNSNNNKAVTTVTDKIFPNQQTIPQYNTDPNFDKWIQEYIENSEVQKFENTEFEDISKDSGNIQDTKLMDFGQQVQTPIDLQKENIQQDLNDKRNTEPINEDQMRIQNVNTLQSKPKNEDLVQTPVETPEETGFWKSAWHKTVKTKDSVVSWFKTL